MGAMPMRNLRKIRVLMVKVKQPVLSSVLYWVTPKSTRAPGPHLRDSGSKLQCESPR